MKESYTSSITQYQESSVVDSVVGFRTHDVFGIRTTGSTAVHLVASIQSHIADFLPINASDIFDNCLLNKITLIYFCIL
jgi:hypothetical protein